MLLLAKTVWAKLSHGVNRRSSWPMHPNTVVKVFLSPIGQFA